MNQIEYPSGIDCVWIASDATSSVAAFITAGSGPIPLQSLSTTNIDFFDIESLLMEIDEKVSFKLFAKVKYPDSFIDLASRGIFVFDWTSMSRKKSAMDTGYGMVASPSIPIKSSSLPIELRREAENVIFSRYAFDESRFIDPRREFNCLEGT